MKKHKHKWTNYYFDGSHCSVCGILRCQCWIDNTHAKASKLECNCQVHGVKNNE